jgi:hypothetical protein
MALESGLTDDRLGIHVTNARIWSSGYARCYTAEVRRRRRTSVSTAAAATSITAIAM